MNYGDVPQVQEQQQVSNPAEDYVYQGDAWKNKVSNDQATQVREALFGCKLPTEDDFEEWFPTLSIAIDLVARVPGYDSSIFFELNRDMEDLVDRANSQGRKKIIASKMQKFIFKLRSLVPKGDVSIPGLTGVGAMITTNNNSKQEIRMPQQPPSPNFLGNIGNMIRGR